MFRHYLGWGSKSVGRDSEVVSRRNNQFAPFVYLVTKLKIITYIHFNSAKKNLKKCTSYYIACAEYFLLIRK